MLGWTGFKTLLKQFARSRAGNISAIMTLVLVPVIGAIGVGGEAAAWYLTQRAIQNAADAAAIAAATNACNAADTCHTVDLQPSYDQEARAAAAKLGFPNGGNTSVVASDAAACPGGGLCYSVTITHKVPFYLLKMVGFTGDTTTTAGVRAQTVSAGAMAQRQPGTGYCVTALGPDGTSPPRSGITVNGGPNVHFENCDAYTPNGSSRCNGVSGGGAFRSSYMYTDPTSNPCPNPAPSGPSSFTDNFSSLYSSLSTSGYADNCAASYSMNGGYPLAPTTGPPATRNVPPHADNLLDAEGDFATRKCGDVRLTQDITVTSAHTLVIYNGRLDLNGFSIRTSGAGGSLTIVFAGSDATREHHFVNTGSGSTTSYVDIAAPTSGPWSGVAVYQNPNLVGPAANIDFEYSTSSKIEVRFSGLFYAKSAFVQFYGNTTYATNGAQCLAFIVYQFEISGSVTASTSECSQAGLNNLPRAYNLLNLVA